VRETLKGDVLSCDHTRRNATGVIDAVNAAMGEAVLADGYEGFRTHTTSSQVAGWVCQVAADSPVSPRSQRHPR
jgi:ATP-dependent helicase/nuclease subunit A